MENGINVKTLVLYPCTKEYGAEPLLPLLRADVNPLSHKHLWLSTHPKRDPY